MQRFFEYDKETKNTVRFQEIDEREGIAIGNIYIKKEFLDEIDWDDTKGLIVEIETFKYI